MTAQRHTVGPDRGKLVLHTKRQGLAATAGHDLTIDVTRWSGEIEVGDDPAASTVSVTVETGSLEVREGTGGVKPLTERDKREIAATMRKLLDSDRQPQATFRSTRVAARAGGGTIDGDLTLRGSTKPLKIEVTDSGDGHYHGTTSVVQTAFGIKPYVAFLGALKVADEVAVDVDLDLSGDVR
jgi:polyisoprenoid-binding protein YceI